MSLADHELALDKVQEFVALLNKGPGRILHYDLSPGNSRTAWDVAADA